MTPDGLIAFFENWGLFLFLLFTALSTTSSILMRIVVSFIKNQQDFYPEYKPSKELVGFLSLLQALALNSPSAINIVKGK